MLKDSSSHYGSVSIFFHWCCAALIIFLFGLGIYMRSVDYYSPWYHRGPELHISLGLLLFALMLLRLVWRSRNKSLEPIASISKQTYLMANLAKISLYIFTFVICVTGYLMTGADGEAAHFFDWFSLPSLFHLHSHAMDTAGMLHKYLAWGLMGIALAHGVAALVHHFVKHDATLLRMLKPAKKTD